MFRWKIIIDQIFSVNFRKKVIFENWSFRNKNLQDRNGSFFMTQVNIWVI